MTISPKRFDLNSNQIFYKIFSIQNSNYTSFMYKKLFFIFVCFYSINLFASHQKIQIVLTNPRSVSTAFEKSIMARNDHKVFHEPWVVSHMYHNGHQHVFNQMPPEELREANGYDQVKALIYRWAEKEPVFLKDMVWCMGDDIYNDHDLLSDPDVVISFLIRDPARSLESFFLKGLEKDPANKVYAFTELVFRYDKLVNIAMKYQKIHGKWPIILEAEQLCKFPEKTMKTFCKQSGISYKESALNWEKRMPDEWKHLSTWHQDAADSKGFYVPKRDKPSKRFSKVAQEHKEFLEKIYQKQKIFYELLLLMKR